MADIGTLTGTITLDDQFSSAFQLFDAHLAKADRSFEAFGGQMLKAGAALTAGVTLPLVGMATQAIQSGMQFEQAINEIQGVLDPTGAQMDRIRELAVQMGADTVFSATDAARAMLELGKAGMTTSDAMASVDEVLQLAAASGFSMEEAASMAARTINAFGLQATDLAHVNDVLAKAVNTTSLDLRDLQVAFNYVGPIATSFGISIEQASAALGIMRDRGIAAETTGRALREGLDRLVNPVKAVEEVMVRLGIETFKTADGGLKPLNEIVGELQVKGMTAADALKLFGNAAGPGMYSLVRSGQAALERLTEGLKNSEGSAQNLADAMMQGLPGAMERLRGSVETAWLSISHAIEPVVVFVADALSNLAQFVADTLAPAFESLPMPIKAGAIAIAALAAAAGPLLLLVGGMATGWGILSTTVAAGAAAFGLGTAAVAANTVAIQGNVLATAEATAAKAVAATAQNTFGLSVATTTPVLWGYTAATEASVVATKSAALGFGTVVAVAAIVVTAIGAIGYAWGQFKDDWTRAFDVVVPGLGGFRDALDVVSTAMDEYKALAADVATVISGTLRQSWQELKFELTDLAGILMGPTVEGWRTLKDIVGVVADTIYGQLEPAIALIENRLNPLYAMFVKLGGSIHDTAEEMRASENATKAVSASVRVAERAIVPLTEGMDLLGKEHTLVMRKSQETAGVVGGDLSAAFKLAKADIEKLTAADRAQIIQFDKHGASVEELANEFKVSEKAITLFLKQTQESTRALKSHASSASVAKDAFESLSGAQTETIQTMILAGRSTAEIARVTGLTERTVELARAAFEKFRTAVEDVDLGKWVQKNNGVTIFLASIPRAVQSAEEALRKLGGSLRDLPSVNLFDDPKTWGRFAGGVDDASDRIEDLRFTWDRAQKAIESGLVGGLSKGLGTLSQAFSQLSQIAGDAFGGVLQAIGEVIAAADLGAKAGQQFLEGMAAAMQGGAGALTQGIIGMVGGITTGIGAIMSATGGGSLVKSMFGGGMAGATLGASIGTTIGVAVTGSIAKGMAVGGPWGALAGLAVGVIVGYFRGKGVRDEMARVGEEWGVSISEGLAKTIEIDAKRFGENAADLLHLGEIMSEAGGMETDPERFLAGFSSVFEEMERGSLSASQATMILDENWQTFADHFTNSSGLLMRRMGDIRDQARAAGLDVAAINDYVRTQVADAASGLSSFFETAASARERLADATSGLVAQEERLAQENAKLRDLEARLAEASSATDRQKITRDIQAQREAITELTAEIATSAATVANQNAIIAATSVTTEAGAVAAGAAIAAMFAEAQASGASVFDALATVQPAVVALQGELEAAGLSGGEAFDAIARYAELAGDEVAGPVLASVEGLNRGLVGLNNSGLLTQQMFTGLTGQVTQAFDALIAQGHTGDDVLRMMGPTLRTIADLQGQFGFTTDESTQALLDQANASGVLSTGYQSDMDKQIAATDRLTEVLERVADALGTGITTAANTATSAVGRIGEAVRLIPRDHTIKFNVETEGQLPEGVELEYRAFAKGGIVTRPTFALIGEAGPEAVIPLDQNYGYSGASAAAAGGPAVVVNMDLRGALVGDLASQEQLARLMSQALGNQAEVRRRAPSFAGGG